MTTSLERIGLFPLETVLFPGAYLPLHIYELRYRQLVRDCLESTQPFGVNLLSKKELHLVGCSATIHAVVQQFSDGRLTIIVVGRQRYILHSIDDSSKPYAIGSVEYFEDNRDEQVDMTLYTHSAQLYNHFVQRIFPEGQQYVLPEDALPVFDETMPSFVMAQKAGLKTEHKQLLLSLRSENERLKFLIAQWEELLPRLDKIEEVLRIIQTDGYFPPGYKV